VPQVGGTYNVVVSFLESGTTNIATATYTIVISAAQAAANASTAPSSASEPSSDEVHSKHHMYKLIDLGTFGGPNSFINCCAGVQPNLSQRGAVVGGADTSIPNPHAVNPNPLLCCEIFVNPAFKWQDGTLIELGALPGGFNGFAVSVNASGAIVGTAENGETDPLQGYPESHPVLWKDGRTIDLGTFGGYEGLAFAINKRGQVAGFAQNAISDPFGYFGFGTQSRAFLWQDGTLQDLGTLGGNNASSDYLNDRGQVAGHSDSSTTPHPAFGVPTFQHPFLWENGRMLDLGTLGGNYGAPMDLNNRGQVVGLSSLAGDLTYHPFIWDEGVLRDLGTLGGPSAAANKTNDAGQVVGYGDLPGGPCQGFSCVHHAFFWEHGVMTDLGTLPTDICSNAVSINRNGLILGYSTPACNSNILSPVIWENGTIYDLSALIVPSPGVTLGDVTSLNDGGEISGLATLPNGDLHAVLLIPCDAEHENVEGCDYKLVDAAAAPSKPTAFTQSTPSTANGVANPLTQNKAMRARFAHWHHRPSFSPNN
jgi:probable HAF family extracellular repeat protein